MNKFRTLSEATNRLREKGYRSEFRMDGEKIECLNTSKLYESHEMEIVEYHRFEGATSPADMSIVFAVSCNDSTKGLIVSSYGTYANNDLLQFMDQVKIADRANAVGRM